MFFFLGSLFRHQGASCTAQASKRILFLSVFHACLLAFLLARSLLEFVAALPDLQVVVVGTKADLAAVVAEGGALASFFPADSKFVTDDLIGRVAPGTDAPSTVTAVVSGGTQVVFAALPTVVSRGNSPGTTPGCFPC